jgi:hypothetical protein
MSLRLRLALAGASRSCSRLGRGAGAFAALRRACRAPRHGRDVGAARPGHRGAGTRPDGQLELARPPADPRFRRPYGGLYWQIEEAGGLRAPARSGTPRSTCPPTRWATVLCMCTGWTAPTVRTFSCWNARSRCLRGLGSGTVRAAVAMDTSELLAARRAFMADLAPYLALLAFTLSAAGWVQLSVGLRPLRNLGARIAALREGRAERMGGDWPVELRPVATKSTICWPRVTPRPSAPEPAPPILHTV